MAPISEADRPLSDLTDEELRAERARLRRERRAERRAPIARIRPVASFEREEIHWLWQDRLARRKLTIIAGDPGLGKSLATLDIAARVSTGWKFPDNAYTGSADVIVANAEDDTPDTIRPRLEAAKADLERVHILTDIEATDDDGNTVSRPFTLADYGAAEDAVDQIEAEGRECACIVIDPISAFLQGVDSHKNTETRAALRPWQELASRRNIAVIGISHLNKRPGGSAIYRLIDSLAFSAAARAVWAVVRDPQDEHRRLFLPVKNNLGPDTGGLAYRIIADETGTPFLEWEDEPVSANVNEVMAAEGDGEEHSQRAEAVDWLRSILSDGPVAVKELQSEAKDSGLAWRTVKRAKSVAGAHARKTGYRGHWVWELPDGPQGGQEGQGNPRGMDGTLGPLGGETADEEPPEPEERGADDELDFF